MQEIKSHETFSLRPVLNIEPSAEPVPSSPLVEITPSAEALVVGPHLRCPNIACRGKQKMFKNPGALKFHMKLHKEPPRSDGGDTTTTTTAHRPHPAPTIPPPHHSSPPTSRPQVDACVDRHSSVVPGLESLVNVDYVSTASIPPDMKRFHCPHRPCQFAEGGKTIKSYNGLRKHFTRAHRSKAFACPKPGCTRVYSLKQDCNRHARICGDNSLFKCTCGVSCSSKSNLKVHVQRGGSPAHAIVDTNAPLPPLPPPMLLPTNPQNNTHNSQLLHAPLVLASDHHNMPTSLLHHLPGLQQGISPPMHHQLHLHVPNTSLQPSNLSHLQHSFSHTSMSLQQPPQPLPHGPSLGDSSSQPSLHLPEPVQNVLHPDSTSLEPVQNVLHSDGNALGSTRLQLLSTELSLCGPAQSNE